MRKSTLILTLATGVAGGAGTLVREGNVEVAGKLAAPVATTSSSSSATAGVACPSTP